MSLVTITWQFASRFVLYNYHTLHTAYMTFLTHRKTLSGSSTYLRTVQKQHHITTTCALVFFISVASLYTRIKFQLHYTRYKKETTSSVYKL